MSPRVSIVLPVYNVAPYIEATIASLLAQTFADFELLVLDDCSTDATVARVEAIRDPRLKLIRNSHNLGRAGTDNAALPHVRGEFIAKMDGDDICHPERLARQVALLEQQPDVNVVGSWMQNFEASAYLNCYPEKPVDAQVLTLFTLPTGNPSVMLRTRLFREGGMRYDEALRQTEDYDFFARYVRELHLATIPEALIHYRVPSNAVKSSILLERAKMADKVREQLLCNWGISFTARELQIHNTISMLDRPLKGISLDEVETWLCKLIKHNETEKLFDAVALRKGLSDRWFEVCYTHQMPLLGSVRHFGRSSLAAYSPITGKQQLKLLGRAISNL